MSWLANKFTELRSFFSGAATTAPEDTTSDISELKVTELKALAKERGLKGYTGLRKAQLVELLKQN
jgi:hypothetical protein|tara:strand:- start:582 stop:779 length:198 start_codon:yes stop_codon:yes gene_type:complete